MYSLSCWTQWTFRSLAEGKSKHLVESPGENSSGKLKLPSSQPTLSYRVGPARDPSDATLCQDDTHCGTICILGQLLYYLHIFSLYRRGKFSKEIFQKVFVRFEKSLSAIFLSQVCNIIPIISTSPFFSWGVGICVYSVVYVVVVDRYPMLWSDGAFGVAWPIPPQWGVGR